MALQAGARIGPYVIGATLDRDVAIKIISPEFTADPERLARFEREARTFAVR